MKLNQGTICRVAIQCTANNGEIGDFLFTGEPVTSNIRDKDSRVSPIFKDLLKLHQWARDNNFIPQRGDYIFDSIKERETLRDEA